MMATWKLAPALAAGCSVVLNPDPLTPLTVIRLAELAAEVGFPAGVVNVVPGDGPTTGAYLVRHPGVDKVAFTGSTKTGGEIMRLASDPVKRVTLELGGKSPNLVFADADLAKRAPELRLVDLLRGGTELRGTLADARREVALRRGSSRRWPSSPAGSSVGDPLDPETQMGSLISSAHRDRVHGFVERGSGDGAEVLAGGVVPDGPGAFYPPTVVAAANDAEIAQEEVFGPVVTVIPFEDEKDAIRIANDVRYGLMATIWTGDPARGPPHRCADQGRARSASTCRTRHFPGSPSAATSSPASGGSSRSRRSISTSRRRASSSRPARGRSTPSGCSTLALPVGGARRGDCRADGVRRSSASGWRSSRRHCRTEYGLSIGEVGLLLAAPWIGGTLTLLPWGIAADRFGERTVLALGLGR